MAIYDVTVANGIPRLGMARVEAENEEAAEAAVLRLVQAGSVVWGEPVHYEGAEDVWVIGVTEVN
jgi:hypothetical protein